LHWVCVRLLDAIVCGVSAQRLRHIRLNACTVIGEPTLVELAAIIPALFILIGQTSHCNVHQFCRCQIGECIQT